MSTVHDITDALVDSAVLDAMAKRAGITLAQARALCAMVADLPVTQAIRMCTTCQLDRMRQAQREARLGRGKR